MACAVAVTVEFGERVGRFGRLGSAEVVLLLVVASNLGTIVFVLDIIDGFSVEFPEVSVADPPLLVFASVCAVDDVLF